MKYCLLSAIVCLLSMPAFSQFGIHAGGNFSYLSSKTGVYSAGTQGGHPFGFLGGFDYNYKIKENLFLQSELNYEFFHGTKLSNYSSIFENNYKLSYIAIPVLLK